MHPFIAYQMKINQLFNNISTNNNMLFVICKHKSKGIFMQLHKSWLEFKHFWSDYHYYRNGEKNRKWTVINLNPVEGEEKQRK